VELKPLVITDFSGINYFCGGKIEKGFNSVEFVESYRQDFKKLDTTYRLKVLFYYIKNKTYDGIYKKEDNRIIGQYFNCGKDLINNLLKKLVDDGCIKLLSEIDIYKLKKEHTYYKLLKEDY
jgi:site-specific DNA-adenine methylase